MLIGILSDTHNNVEMAIKAVDYFRKHGITVLIHAGDLSSPHMLDFFRGFELHIVLGNCDCDNDELRAKATEVGIQPICCRDEFELDGKSFVVFHGDNVPMFREAVDSEKYDYIIKGHTHCYENYERKKSRIINPGSLCRGEENSIAVLDTDTGQVSDVPIGTMEVWEY